MSFKDVKQSLNRNLNWLFIVGGVYIGLNSISRRVVKRPETLNWMHNWISCPLGDITCIIPLTEGGVQDVSQNDILADSFLENTHLKVWGQYHTC
jgi:hypothetical protein